MEHALPWVVQGCDSPTDRFSSHFRCDFCAGQQQCSLEYAHLALTPYIGSQQRSTSPELTQIEFALELRGERRISEPQEVSVASSCLNLRQSFLAHRC
mmetsp:Transcript_37852/g.100754  ORF Transcript_37852/g.100754 Transcript_37852/m.100754 type:complete len:98 (+) Transcript_37852:226-519(+)